MPDTLDRLIEDGVIDGVRARLMSGKEAAVFIVERRGELLAAKVYKAREQRTFKATASYTEGRSHTRNSRDQRAMHKRTRYGRELMEESWRDVEVRALSEAFHAGVRVPQPFMLHDDVLLMELLVDEAGAPAPRLADFDLQRETAELLFREIFSQVRMLLACGKIHGDLSAFNILMARGGPTLIDLPQVVDAARNNQAREILRRDLCNIAEHLSRYDARLLRFRDCGDALWQHYVRGTLEAATEPQAGGVGGGAHRGRRTRDAERGRMGRERPEGGGFRHDGPQRPGPPAHSPSGANPRPEHPQPRQRFEHGPPRDGSTRPDAPPGQASRREGGQRPPHPESNRPGPPRHEGNTQRPPRYLGNGPPRAEGSGQGATQNHGSGPPRREGGGPGPARHHGSRPPYREGNGPGPARPHDNGPPRREGGGPGPARPHDNGPPRREGGGPGPARHHGSGPRAEGNGPGSAQHPGSGPPRPEGSGQESRRHHFNGPPRRDETGGGSGNEPER